MLPETIFHKSPWIEGEYQYFEDNDGTKWKRKFDMSGSSNHGKWEKISGGGERMERVDKINYYLDQAEVIAERSTCLRRQYGAIIVKNDEPIASGYNGAPRGVVNCCDVEFCMREIKNIPAGERYEMCRSVHAEMNAMLSAKRSDMIGSTMYLVGLDVATGSYSKYNKPCKICSRMIINSGIEEVVMRIDKQNYETIVTASLQSEMDEEMMIMEYEAKKIKEGK